MTVPNTTTATSAENEARVNPFAKQPAKIQRVLKLPTAVLDLDISPDGSKLFGACLGGEILEVEPVSGEFDVIAKHESYASGVACVGADEESGQKLVSAGYDGAVGWHATRPGGRTTRRARAHDFWSWQLAAHPGAGLVASAGGQYLCGGYKYEPARSEDPPVKLLHLATGELVHALEHVPPVQSVAFSDDGRHVAAGNLMGEIRVWETSSGKLLRQWTTPSFTGWGIIKGHYYTGGIFSMFFTPAADELVVAGMGTTRDPAAGNGRQLWQRFRWQSDPVEKTGETREDESGSGLMETVTLHPSKAYFVMGGRVAKGKWNVAFFDSGTGRNLHSLTTKSRVTRAVFSPDGRTLYLAGAVKQGRHDKDGNIPPWGRIHVYEVPPVRMAF